MDQNVKVKFKSVSKKYNLYRKQSDKLFDLLIPKKRPKEFYALRDISFEVYEGETVGIIGINGSGKSTLSNLLAQVVPPSSGTIEVNGEPSLIAISAGLNSSLTGIENIRLKCLMLGFKTKDIETIIPEIVEFADIGEFINQPVKNYSSGMKSRLGFAISVHTDPDILVIDEALSVGDDTFYEKCLVKVNEFKEKGKTIFFISHSVGQIRSFTDRAIWINFGRMEDIGRTPAVLAKYKEFIKWFNSLDSKQQKKYKAEKLQEQMVSSTIPESTDKVMSYSEGLSRSDKKKTKVESKQKSNFLFAFQVFFLTLFMLLSMGLMFIGGGKALVKSNLLNHHLGFVESKSQAKEPQKKIIINKSKTLSINKNGRIKVNNGILYNDLNLKAQKEVLSFASEVFIKKKTDNIYLVKTSNNEGFMNVKDVQVEKDLIMPVSISMGDIVGLFSKNFAGSYQFFLAQLKSNYSSITRSLNGLTAEQKNIYGETILDYGYDNLSIVFEEQKPVKIITTKINSNSSVVKQLVDAAQMKSTDNQEYFIRISGFDLILDLTKNELSISLTKL